MRGLTYLFLIKAVTIQVWLLWVFYIRHISDELQTSMVFNEEAHYINEVLDKQSQDF